MSARALAPGEAPPRRRATRRWAGPGLLDWFVPSRSELVLLVLLAAFLAPFAGFMGPLTAAATLARWPLLGAALVWFFLASRRAGSLRVVPLPLAIAGLFLLAAGASSLLSPTPRVSGMKFAALVAVLLLTHAFAARVLAPMQWVRLLATLGVVLAALTLPTLLYGESIIEEYYRTEGAFGTGPNAVGVLGSMALLLVVPFGLRFLVRRNEVGFWAVALCCVGIVVVLLATGSRSSAGAAAGGFLIWMTTFGGRQVRLLWTIAAVLLAAAVLLSFSEFVQDQVAFLFRERGFSLDAFESRWWIWEAALEAWAERPLLGWGYGAAGNTRDIVGVAAQAVSVRDGSGYFGLLEGVGLLGIALFAAYLGAMLLYRAPIARMPAGSLVKAAASAAYITHFGLAVHHVGEPWLLGPGSPINLIFWLTGAAVIVLCQEPDDRNPAPRPVAP